MVIGYKVVRIDNGELVSAFNDGYIRKYSVGEWTKPRDNDGPLALFKEKKQAVDFFHIHSSCYNKHLIYKCEYEESDDNTLWCCTPDGMKIYIYFNIPNNTIFADKIKLIEKMDIN